LVEGIGQLVDETLLGWWGREGEFGVTRETDISVTGGVGIASNISKLLAVSNSNSLEGGIALTEVGIGWGGLGWRRGNGLTIEPIISSNDIPITNSLHGKRDGSSGANGLIGVNIKIEVATSIVVNGDPGNTGGNNLQIRRVGINKGSRIIGELGVVHCLPGTSDTDLLLVLFSEGNVVVSVKDSDTSFDTNSIWIPTVEWVDVVVVDVDFEVVTTSNESVCSTEGLVLLDVVVLIIVDVRISPRVTGMDICSGSLELIES